MPGMTANILTAISPDPKYVIQIWSSELCNGRWTFFNIYALMNSSECDACQMLCASSRRRLSPSSIHSRSTPPTPRMRPKTTHDHPVFFFDVTSMVYILLFQLCL